MTKVIYIAAVLAAPVWAPAAIIAAALLTNRKRPAPTPDEVSEADRTARLFSAIDELAYAATDVILASQPDVDRDRIRNAVGQGVTGAILDLTDIARGV